MSNFHLTEYEFVDVQRWVSEYSMTPRYAQREAGRLLVERVGELHDKARARKLHETQKEEEFKRKTSVSRVAGDTTR